MNQALQSVLNSIEKAKEEIAMDEKLLSLVGSIDKADLGHHRLSGDLRKRMGEASKHFEAHEHQHLEELSLPQLMGDILTA